MRTWLALTCLLFVGCDRRTRAIDVELVPSSDTTTRADLEENVETLEYTIDAVSGPLYPLDHERTRGFASIEQADDDPTDLELVIRTPFSRTYPVIRINEGSLPDVPLAITVRARAADGSTYAIGSVRGVTLERGVKDVRIVLGRVSISRPRVSVLRVLEDPCVDPKMLVVFSTPVTPQSVLAADAIRFMPGGAARGIVLEASGTTAIVGVPLELLDPQLLSFTLEIGQGIESPTGEPFDQVPTTSQLDSFVGTYDHLCR